MMFTFATAVLLLAAPSLAEDETTCEPMRDGSCKLGAGAGQASLLQKTVSRNEKKAVAHNHMTEQQPNKERLYGGCDGTPAQGQCWFLSELGESCASTCSKSGRAFTYVVADNAHPVTPSLVGHEPNLKQEPWAALECYVPEEDRFHTANANAAKHFDKDIGAWSHESCKLACPCSNSVQPLPVQPLVTQPVTTQQPVADTTQCSWKQPAACAPEFEWKGKVYAGCAVENMEHDRPWCQHEYHHHELKNAPQDWSYCTYNCPAPAPAPAPVPENNCEWTPASTCAKEFSYKGNRYTGCTSTDLDKLWCSNTDTYAGSWSYCTSSCGQDDCFWQAGSECASSFEYKGVRYNGCTTEDHPTPWCSHDSVHEGSWTTCQKVCTKAPSPVNPVPAPAPTPVPAPAPTPAPVPEPVEEDPCTRHPDVENDMIGATVTLDEVGYKIAAAADSPINMKRFVCRVVDKLECKVTDIPSLMAFVPYYSGLVSLQTYNHLDAELETLCHAGGKWIVPIDEAYWNAP